MIKMTSESQWIFIHTILWLFHIIVCFFLPPGSHITLAYVVHILLTIIFWYLVSEKQIELGNIFGEELDPPNHRRRY